MVYDIEKENNMIKKAVSKIATASYLEVGEEIVEISSKIGELSTEEILYYCFYLGFYTSKLNPQAKRFCFTGIQEENEEQTERAYLEW